MKQINGKVRNGPTNTDHPTQACTITDVWMRRQESGCSYWVECAWAGE